MPLPTVPGLPPKPAYTGFGPTKKEREAAAASTRASQPAPRGGIPPWRVANRGVEPRHDSRSGSSNFARSTRVSAEPRASTPHGDPTHRLPFSHGDQTNCHHPYSHPSGRAEPTTPAVLQQPQAVTQLRVENPYSRRPDHDPAVRGLSRTAQASRRKRSQQPAGRAFAKPLGDRDGKRSVSALSSSAASDRDTRATTKRKASATPAPSSPRTKRQRTSTGAALSAAVSSGPASVSASASVLGSASPALVTKTEEKAGSVTSGLVSSPVASATTSAPLASSLPTATRNRTTRRSSAAPVPRRSLSSQPVTNAAARIAAWASTLKDDDDDAPVASSSSPAASPVLASSAALPAPAPVSASTDAALANSGTRDSLPRSAPSVSVSAVVSVSPSLDNTDAAVSVSVSVSLPVSSVSTNEHVAPMPVSAPSAGKSVGKSGYARKAPASKLSSVSGQETTAKSQGSRTARKAQHVRKSIDKVSTGRVSKPKPHDTKLNKNGHPTTGGKTTWPGKVEHPDWYKKWEKVKTVSSSGGEKDDNSKAVDSDDLISAASGGEDDTVSVSSIGEGEILETEVLSSGGEDQTLSSDEDSEAMEVEVTGSLGGKTVYFTSTPESDGGEVSLADAPGLVTGQTSSPKPVYKSTTIVDEKTGAQRATKSPVALTTLNTASSATGDDKDDQLVDLEARVGMATRLFPVRAGVLEGFSTWWSRQEAGESSCEMNFDEVFAEINGLSTREVKPQEILSVMEKILGMITREPGAPSAETKGCSSTELWLAALMYGVLGLPQEVIEGLRSSLHGLLRGCLEDGIAQHHNILLDAGLEKLTATASIFGWEAEWRWLVMNLAHSCAVREDGRLVNYGVALEEKICGRSTSDIIHNARRKVIMAMRNNAMVYLADMPKATCRSEDCWAFHETAIIKTLYAAGLYPWPKAEAASAALADGRSIHEITVCLSACCSNGDLLGETPGALPDHRLCETCADPLPGLFEAVGNGSGGRLATIIGELAFGGN